MNINLKTIKYTKEAIGSKLMDLGLRGVFENLTPEAKEVKAKMNKTRAT